MCADAIEIYYLSNRNSGLSAEGTFDENGALRSDTLLSNSVSGGVATSPHDPAGFGGQFGYYTDTETGLLCLTHRYYDPGTGKFLNRDPIGYDGGMNLYGFAGGNPVNEIDPNGYNPLLSWNDFKQGIGTGWAGFSTSVWNTPGLSNLNRKYSIYSAGDYANQPGFNTSVTLGTIGITVLPTSGVFKLGVLLKAAKATQAARIVAGRLSYVGKVQMLASKGQTLLREGKDAEEVARTLHAERRLLGIRYKNLTPLTLRAKIYLRNIKKYGDPLGPSIDYLRGQGKTWEQIISSASRAGGKDIGL